MQVNAKTIGAGVAAAIAAGLGYALVFHNDDEVEHDVILRDRGYSVRSYPQLLVAETVTPGLRDSAFAVGFLALAEFLDDSRRGGPRLAMTTPVLVDGDDDGRGWRTRFVLPPALAGAAPADGIRIRALAARRVAVLRFAGETSDSALDRHEADLRYWMETQGLRPAGPVEHAFYSSPFVPAMLRRNEVLIPLMA